MSLYSYTVYEFCFVSRLPLTKVINRLEVNFTSLQVRQQTLKTTTGTTKPKSDN